MLLNKGGGGGGGSHLLLYVGVGGSEQPVDLWCQISAHLSRTHTGQCAQSQRLHILVTVRKVTAKHTHTQTSTQMTVRMCVN